MRQFQFTISAEHIDPDGAAEEAPYTNRQLFQFKEPGIHDIEFIVIDDFAGTRA